MRLKNVLIVDDSSTMRRTIRQILEDEHYRITEAANGKEALSAIQSEKTDLVISDLNMPQMDGLELLKSVRSFPDNKELPFIMLTSSSEKEQVAQAAMSGVNTWILKDRLIENLLEQVKKLCPPFE